MPPAYCKELGFLAHVTTSRGNPPVLMEVLGDRLDVTSSADGKVVNGRVNTSKVLGIVEEEEVCSRLLHLQWSQQSVLCTVELCANCARGQHVLVYREVYAIS